MEENHYEVRWVARGWGAVHADRTRRFDDIDKAERYFDEKEQDGMVDSLELVTVSVLKTGRP